MKMTIMSKRSQRKTSTIKSLASRLYTSVKSVYLSRYLALNIAVAVVYYLLFSFLIRYQNYGIFLVTVPLWLEYATIISSSILLTLSVYLIYHTKRKLAELSTGSVSIVTIILSGVFGGCGCAAPLLAGLATIGISSSEALFNLSIQISEVVVPIFGFLVILNIALAIYYLSAISKPAKK